MLLWCLLGFLAIPSTIYNLRTSPAGAHESSHWSESSQDSTHCLLPVSLQSSLFAGLFGKSSVLQCYSMSSVSSGSRDIVDFSSRCRGIPLILLKTRFRESFILAFFGDRPYCWRVCNICWKVTKEFWHDSHTRWIFETKQATIKALAKCSFIILAFRLSSSLWITPNLMWLLGSENE